MDILDGAGGQYIPEKSDARAAAHEVFHIKNL